MHKCQWNKTAYLIPRSMCSWIPKPKQPLSLKFFRSNSYSLTFNPLSRSCMAFSPLTVTQQAIFSLRLIPKLRTVYLAIYCKEHYIRTRCRTMKDRIQKIIKLDGCCLIYNHTKMTTIKHLEAVVSQQKKRPRIKLRYFVFGKVFQRRY